MGKISGVIITYNEEEFIGNCIKSLQGVVDEIVVIDSYSTDKTKEICLNYDVRFVENAFSGFTDQKNFANSQASYDFVLSLDADEELSPTLRESILMVKDNLEFDGYSFNRLNNYCGKWLKHSGWYPDCKIRLFNPTKASWKGDNNIHEIIELNNPQSHKHLNGDLLHWAYKSFSAHCLKINKYSDIAARNIVLRNPAKRVSMFKVLFNPFWKFFKNYFIKRGFLDGFAGFTVCMFSAFETFMKYAKIRQLQSNKELL